VRERASGSSGDRWRAAEADIDLCVAPPTRIAAYLDGADAHFAVDREVAEQMFASVRGGVEAFRAVARIGQAFLQRVVHHLVVEAGVRQFLVTGYNLSDAPNVHDMAQDLAPESRVAYVVLDPVVLAHAHTLGRSSPPGTTAYVVAKLRDTDDILDQAAATLDLSAPVGLVFPANLGFVRRDETAHRIVDGLMGPLVAGSHLAITHHASDLMVDEYAEMFRSVNRLAAEGKTWGVRPRSHAEVRRFFDGLELVEPGVVPMWAWRAPEPACEKERAGAIYAGVGRKR
jgi:hypothetical protein